MNRVRSIRTKSFTELGSSTKRSAGMESVDTMAHISMKENTKLTSSQGTEESFGAMEEFIPVSGKTMHIMAKVPKSSLQVRPEKVGGV